MSTSHSTRSSALDDTHLTCDARLPDGSRVHIVMPPLCEEISIAIRKFQKSTLSIQDLIRSKTLTPEVASFLEVAINIQKNMVVSGGTSSGKTTLLNLLSSYIPEQARLVVIED